MTVITIDKKELKKAYLSQPYEHVTTVEAQKHSGEDPRPAADAHFAESHEQQSADRS